MTPEAITCIVLVASLGRFCGFGGTTLWVEELVKLPHRFKLEWKVFTGYGAVSKRLYHLQLLYKEEVERVNFGAVILTLKCLWRPLLGGFQVLLPIGYSSFEREFTEMADCSRFRVASISLLIGDTLPPAVNEDSDGAHHSATKNAGSRSNDRNTLYVFLFLWGHHPLALLP